MMTQNQPYLDSFFSELNSPKAGKTPRYGNLIGCSLSLLASYIVQHHNLIHQAPVVLWVPDRTSAEHYRQALTFFLKGPALPLSVLPDWETLPYDHFSPPSSIISERLKLLYQLPTWQKGVLIVPLCAGMQRLPPQSYVHTHSFTMACGERCSAVQWREHLTRYGYQHVAQVVAPGELSVRGSILDVFPSGSKTPWRIDLLDDEIDSIRAFDPDTQRSLPQKSGAHTVQSVEILPAYEYPLDQDSIARFRQAWHKQFAGNPSDCPLYQRVSQGQPSAGLEYYLPLFFEKTDTLFDYLPEQTLFLLTEGLNQAAEQYWKLLNTRYEQYRHDYTRPLLAPVELCLPTPDMMGHLKQFCGVSLQSSPTKTEAIEKGEKDFAAQALPDITVQPRAKVPLKALAEFLQNSVSLHQAQAQSQPQSQPRVLFCCETLGRREVVLELLATLSIYPTPVETWQQFLDSDISQAIVVAPIDNSVVLTALNIIIISEFQLVGHSAVQQRKRKPTQHAQDMTQFIYSLAELAVDDLVVHVEYGIGRYLGLEVITTQGQAAEYLKLSYADEAKLYIPITDLHLISRYTGIEPSQVQLSHLGTKKWQKAKEKAAARARDAAAELLDVYAQRAQQAGLAFEKPDADYQQFEQAFPFELTPDQAQAIDSVIADMTSPHPMDRLICGDVGFGKTEVAMRAAFLCVKSHKQVMLLVPTTVLASQHTKRFKDRFAQWPIKIETLSRSQPLKVQQRLLEELREGKLDIVIGTHKLLSKKIAIKNLGLLIVDEEHRFGVRQKEHIKSLRANVDILTLTATPIPRTLNLSLVSLRDISIIATPPQKRLPVKTFIHEYSDTLLQEAIRRELLRGGQVYFLHNSVKTIASKAQELVELVPGATIKVAHGQMSSQAMEGVMDDFYHQRFNILVCTTIIESGIDIPTVNTIIIEKADKFGLAQLHQLRGRVGRSHHQAYAYFMTRPASLLTADAIKRLDAIASLDNLGAGFMLAHHDLEIRGAGELLGEGQSGHMEAIGFDLYMKLLNAAIESIKKGILPSHNGGDALLEHSLNKAGVTVELDASALIPDTYIADVHTRLVLYKRLAQVTQKKALEALQVEMIDRFGLLPVPAKNLMKLTELKLKLSSQGVKAVKVNGQVGQIEFYESAPIDISRVMALIQKHSKQYKLLDGHRLQFAVATAATKTASVDEQIQAVVTLLGQVVV